MSSLPDALKDLRAALKPQMPEDEVEHLLSPLYILLGYQQTGKDIRRKRKGRSGIPDVLLLNSDESVQAVVEVKRPSEGVSDHLEQVKKYMLELRSPFGILTNGSWWVFYRLDGKNVRILERYTTEDLERDPSPFEVLRKQTLELTDFVAVKARLENQEGLVLRQLGELPTEQFLQSFGLEASSPFCELVEATYGLLGQLEGKSKFVSGSFDFWSKIYAREVGVDEVPKLWRDSGIPLPATVDGLKRFSFVLETAYTLAARLILAKAIEDHDSAGNIVADPLGKRLLNQLSAKKVGRGATIPLEAYPQAVETLFNDYALQLFTSIYATDIFDWWRDYALHPDPAGEKFARALARVLLSLLRFNFSELQGDLLGELYQSYFDPETRKALGEFYTPPAVVNFILDEVGYSGDRQSRLLDPATGSGTFIVQALRRYLKENASADPVKTLEGITQEYRLVAFDVNPFAVLMAQINFAAELVPLYTRAIVQDKNFTLRRLPIVRTDSLRQEPIEGELLRDKAQVGLNFEGDTIKPRIQLPVKLENGTFKTVELELPQYHYAREQSGWGIVNEAGWLSALQAIFAAVEATSQAFDRDSSIKFDLSAALHLELSKRFSSPDKLQSGLEQYVSKLWDTLRDLKQNHGDGRFLKTLEDLTLGLILKHYLKYDYVVGNPPYVKTQNLPEDSRRYWEGLYKWAHGNFDIYVPFLERALATDHPWLNEGGVVGYILPNRFLNANYTEQLRLELPACASVRSITDFTAVTFQPPTETQASKLFREAMVYPAILIAEKKGAEEAGTDSSDPLTVTRFYPRPARIAPETALREVRGAYATLRDGKTPDALEHAQTFTQSQAVLQGKGWYLMPELEQKVFNKLEAVGKQYDPELGKPQQDEAGANLKLERRLKNYTATSSGGFQGIATGLDGVMVLEQLDENLEKGLLLVRPKGGHVEPFWAEKAALRKFLFGKDVKRWALNWEKWWVIFPYFEYKEMYKLMPSSQYRHWQFVKKATVFEPFAQYPADAPLIDQVYPKLWAYLKSQEKDLRAREKGRYKTKLTDEYRWYDLARPQSLEFVEKPKIVLQVSSNNGKYVQDSNGYFFTAGGTSGVYGLSPIAGKPTGFLTALLNSNPLDFILKKISSVFGGGYYSYGDQFIKNLPIPPATLEGQTTLSTLAQKLSANAAARARVRGQLEGFPRSAQSALEAAGIFLEQDALGNLAQDAGLSKSLSFKGARLEHTLLGKPTLRLGKGTLTLPSETHGGAVLAALEAAGKLDREALLSLSLPVKPKGVQKFLDMLEGWKGELVALEAEYTQLEAELNTQVYTLFALTPEEIAVVEGFLERF